MVVSDSSLDHLSLTPVPGEAIYMQIYRLLIKAFRTKLLAPGDRLPPDMQLAQKLKVNHLTLKKALNKLAEEGLLVRVQGRGTYVPDTLPEGRVSNIGKQVSFLVDVAEPAMLFNDSCVQSIYIAIERHHLSMEIQSAKNCGATQFRQIMERFNDSNSAGCIVWPLLDLRQLEKLAVTKPENYPLIFINHKPALDIRGIDFSGYDDFGSGVIMGQKLKEQKFKKVIVIQQKCFRDTATDINRIGGIAAALQYSPEIFNDFLLQNISELKEFLEEQDRRTTKTAVVFINDCDYEFIHGNYHFKHLIPFAFFSLPTDFGHGVLLPNTRMGANAVNILLKRINGDQSFSICERFAGTWV